MSGAMTRETLIRKIKKLREKEAGNEQKDK